MKQNVAFPIPVKRGGSIRNLLQSMSEQQHACFSKFTVMPAGYCDSPVSSVSILHNVSRATVRRNMVQHQQISLQSGPLLHNRR